MKNESRFNYTIELSPFVHYLERSIKKIKVQQIKQMIQNMKIQ